MKKLNAKSLNDLSTLISYLVNFSVENVTKIETSFKKSDSLPLLTELYTFYTNQFTILGIETSETNFFTMLSELLTFSFFSFYFLDLNGSYESVIRHYLLSSDFVYFEIFKTASDSEITVFFTSLNFKKLYTYLKDLKIIDELISQEDPFKFIYENFLHSYNKALVKKSGSYYSPLEPIQFITSSVMKLLTESQNEVSLVNQNITILDPSCGTGSFLLEIAKGLDQTLTKENKIHLIGYEVNPVSYFLTIQNLRSKLSSTSKVLGRKNLSINNISPIENIEIFKEQSTISTYFSKSIQNLESLRNASSLMRIIIGNPPYSAVSNNRNNWIDNLLKGKIENKERMTHNYFEVNGISINERKSGWLYDDYVKFIRFGQWLLDNSEQGVLSYICNSGFLSNPSFRGMRFQLLQTFDEMYIIDLHGNKKTDNPPANIIDENIFDIVQDICIFIFIKRNIQSNKSKMYKYFDIWGTKEEKLQFLQSNDYATINWSSFSPQEPFYNFIPEDTKARELYSSFWSLKDIFTTFGTGLITSKDSLALQFSKKELIDVLKDFTSLEPEQARIKYNLGPDTENWKVITAQKDVIDNDISEKLISQILYRPFDMRYTFFTGKANGFHGRPKAISKSLFNQENLALVSARTNKTGVMDHFFVSSTLTEAKCAESSTQSYVFPLKIVENGKIIDNINQEFISSLKQIFQKKNSHASNLESILSTINIFSYIYALVYSDAYRDTFKTFMAYDFPRIPLISNMKVFQELVRLGDELIQYHLMEFDVPVNFRISSNSTKRSEIKKVLFKDSRVYITNDVYFYPIDESVYNFTIGNYKVLKKWLSGRKKRILSENEIKEFKKIIFAIQETQKIVQKINKAINTIGNF